VRRTRLAFPGSCFATKRPTALKDLMKNPAPNSPSQVGIISDAIMGSLLRRTGFVIYSTIVGILLMRTSVISGVSNLE
jgi:hypothetical protein